jgi:nickel/cobalt exporter
VFAGAILLGFIHGIEPGHGWPVAATYALDRDHKWLSGLAASSILGIGHLISSIAMVAVFFWAKSYFDLAQINDPIVLADGVAVGGPMGLAAGVLLIALGIREYRHGHSHDHGIGSGSEDDTDRGAGHHTENGQQDHGGGHGDHDVHHDHGGSHGHAPHDHSHHDHDDGSLRSRIESKLPFVGGDDHDHSHPDPGDAADRGLVGIAGFAFLLGFAHEEEFEIIGLCLGSSHCLTLMLVYALTVIVGIVGLTLLLIAGYERYEDRVEKYADHLPTVSAAVLIVMGIGFVLGLF